MSFKIVSDSSSNVLSMGDSNYTTVPLKIIAEKAGTTEEVIEAIERIQDKMKEPTPTTK